MNKTIQISRIDGFDRIDRDAWNQLIASSRTATVFQTHEWHSAWWEVYGEEAEPLLLCATEGGALVGVAALCLYRDPKGHAIVRFMGHRHSDYSDIICAANRDDVRNALLSYLLAPQSSWNRMDLKNVPADSPTLGQLEHLGAAVGRHSLVVKTIPCPTLLIRGHEEFFARVRNKKSLRRHYNYFRKQPRYAAEHFRDAAQILPQLDAFFSQHIERWTDTTSPSLFNEEHNRRFYRAVVAALDGTGWLRFTRLVADGQPIAFHLGFAGWGRFIWYKPTFDAALARKSPGEALLKELLELAATEGHDEFDFTVGNEPFKYRFTNHTRYNVTVAGYTNRLHFEGQRAYVRAKGVLKRSSAGRAMLNVARSVITGK